MASKQNEVLLDLDDEHEDSFFSGFSSDEIKEKDVSKGKSKSKTKLKSTVTKATPKEKVLNKKGTKSQKKCSEKSNNPVAGSSKECSSKIDLSSMTRDDIDNLKELLGLSGQLASQNMQNTEHRSRRGVFSSDTEEDDFALGHDIRRYPNMRVNFNPRDLSDDEIDENLNPHDLNMNEAMFDVLHDKEWDLPISKTPAKGKPISSSLAKMLNVACTSQCETDSLVNKYSLPENCSKAGAPLVNAEIWQAMTKQAQVQDRSLVRIQNLVAGTMVPIIKLSELLKSQLSSNSEAKILFSDALTLMGQTQFALSIRRRYCIRPVLKKKYAPLCKISQPITDKLFGDEVSKEIKACDSMTALGKYDGFYNKFRGAAKFGRRGAYRDYNRSGSYHDDNRYQPYPQRGGYRERGRQFRRKFGTTNSTSTFTPAPNDKQ